MDDLVWTQETRHVSELKSHPNNPRRVPKDKFNVLLNNIKNNGYTNRLIINTKNLVLGGNQRLRALKELGYSEVEVLVPNRDLTLDEEDRINITDNLSAGDWNFDALSSWDVEKLTEWGMPVEWLLGSDDKDAPKKESNVVEKKIKHCPACGEILV